MASTGGKVSFLGITPEFIATTGTISAQNGTIQGLGQVWKGAGQTYFGSAGQSLAGNLAGSAVNIALNSAFGTNVPGPNGIPLDSGANILASTITPYVTSTVAAGINQQLQQSLQSAGPFGPVLSSLGTGLVNQAFQGLTNSIASATSTATNYKMFPGADGIGEVPAVYNGGGSYTLTDIVFSLQPANMGPQMSGDQENVNDPKTKTTAATTQVAGNSGTAKTAAVEESNVTKAEKMAVGSPGKTERDRAILKFMKEGQPSKAEFEKLTPVEQEVALDLVQQSKEVLEPLPAAGYFGSWSFITAPEDVSWDVANAANRVEMFGTNNPPVVAGSRGMRDLTLSNALVEGFVRGVSLEGKIAALENLMNYKLNSSDGFVSVPVYQVWASEKSYGGPEAYYIIKDIKVQEKMRDLKGNVTRALVDISLMQVPAYQVNSGRDQASQTTTGGRNQLLLSQAEARALQRQRTSGQVAKDAATKQVDGRTQSNVSKPEQRSGPPVGAVPTLEEQVIRSFR